MYSSQRGRWRTITTMKQFRTLSRQDVCAIELSDVKGDYGDGVLVLEVWNDWFSSLLLKWTHSFKAVFFIDTTKRNVFEWQGIHFFLMKHNFASLYCFDNNYKIFHLLLICVIHNIFIPSCQMHSAIWRSNLFTYPSMSSWADLYSLLLLFFSPLEGDFDNKENEGKVCCLVHSAVHLIRFFRYGSSVIFFYYYHHHYYYKFKSPSAISTVYLSCAAESLLVVSQLLTSHLRLMCDWLCTRTAPYHGNVLFVQIGSGGCLKTVSSLI